MQLESGQIGINPEAWGFNQNQDVQFRSNPGKVIPGDNRCFGIGSDLEKQEEKSKQQGLKNPPRGERMCF